MPSPVSIGVPPLSQEEEARILAASPALNRVANWVLPNDDVAADDDELLREFEASLDDMLRVTDAAIERVARRHSADHQA